jgi:RNA polymerase sigma factor for flagellar operon FliA
MGLREDLDRPWEEFWRDGGPTHNDRQSIINSFVPLARAIARKLKAGLPGHVPYDDLVSAGVVGLISAVDRFDPEKGHNFRRYAAIRIKGAMLDELRQMDWAPRSVRREGGQVTQARKELEAKLGRRPEAAEMAEHMEMEPDEYAQMVKRLAPQTIIRFEDLGIRRDSERQNVFNFLMDPNSPDPFEQNELKDAYDLLVRAVDDLKEKPRQVISLYYFEGLNLKEIATIFGVTESRISQIHSAAIQTLKKKVRNMS